MSGAGAVAFAAPAAGGGWAAGLRGAAPAAAARAAPAEAGAAASPWLLGSAAALAAAAAAGAGRRQARGPRRALPTATAAAVEPVEKPLAPAGAFDPDKAPPPPPPPFDPAKAVGVTAPLGYFDPLGFCKVGDYEGFHKLRSSELKHGRVAMLAAAGTVFAHFVKLPGFESTPAGLGALTDPFGVLGFSCLLLPVVLALETVYWKDDDLSKEPGNFGDPSDWAGLFGAFGGGYSDEIRNKEINNGRMAMISIWGILGAEIATGKDGIQQFGIDVAPAAAELTVAAGSAAPVAAALSSAAPVPAGL